MENFILTHQWIIWLAIAWTIPWKAVALWKSARNGHSIWFSVLFIFNTLAILEIIYLFFFGRKKYASEPTQGYTNYSTSPGGNSANLIRGL